MNETALSAECRRPSALASSGPAPRRARRPAIVLACCAAAAATLAACGSGAAGSGPADGSAADVTIGKAVDNMGFTPVDVAKAKGYFTKQGVNVKEEVLSGSSTAFAALRSGSVNFVTASSTAMLNAKAKGVPLEAVASLTTGVGVQLLASKSWIKSHGLSPNQPLNTVMKKMVGAKLADISTTDLTYEHYLEKQAGVDPGKFSYIQIDSQSAAVAALKHGQIDAFLLSPPSTYFAQSQGGAQIIATLRQVPALATMAYDVLVVDSNWAKSHASEVSAVATAIAMADNTMRGSPQSVLSIEQQHYPKMSSSVLLDSLKYTMFTQDGLSTQDEWQKALSEFRQTGSNKASGIDVSENAGLWTNQYIKKSELSDGSVPSGEGSSQGASPSSSGSS